jgi:hypothetical protein
VVCSSSLWIGGNQKLWKLKRKGTHKEIVPSLKLFAAARPEGSFPCQMACRTEDETFWVGDTIWRPCQAFTEVKYDRLWSSYYQYNNSSNTGSTLRFHFVSYRFRSLSAGVTPATE